MAQRSRTQLLTSQHEDDGDEITYVPARNERLNAPQLEAQLSRLSDRSRVRRLKNTLVAKGAWRQVARIEDMFLSPLLWLSLLQACSGSVLAPHDFFINVQKRWGDRAYTGEGGCRLCGAFFDLQLEDGEFCSTAGATRGHHAYIHTILGGLKLADPGVTTEPRGLTETQSRPADLFTAAAVLGRSAAPDVCGIDHTQQSHEPYSVSADVESCRNGPQM